MPYNIRWCANCEELVAVEDGIEGHTILVGEFPFDVVVEVDNVSIETKINSYELRVEK